MQRVFWSLLTVSSLCGLSLVSANEPTSTKENKTSQLYYQNGVTPQYYQQGYGFVPNYNQQVRPVSNQVCMPGVGCGTFYPATNTQTNFYGQTNCGPYGCYVNQPSPANYGCPNGNCGINRGYNQGYMGMFPGNSLPIPPAPNNFGYSGSIVYPSGTQYSLPAYSNQYFNNGALILPSAPLRGTPVYPSNYIVQGNSSATAVESKATTATKSTVSNNYNNPYFE